MSGFDRKLRLAVLISGGGSNLQSMIDRSAAGELAAEVVVVISDRPDAYGLVRAEKALVPHFVVDYGSHGRADQHTVKTEVPGLDLEELDRTQKILREPDREKRLRRLTRLVSAERELISTLDRFQPDFVCLAGYMRLVTPFFIHHYKTDGRWRVLNIHPALLPAFPGMHGYEDTLAYGCRWGGVTVHFVDEGEDSGPIIAQAVYPIWPGDTLDSIRKRGLQLEYAVYAQCINWLAQECVRHDSLQGLTRIATITDPAYPSIVRGWVEMAIAR